ncbi:MAG TPA: hypothetical protein VEY93_04345 [Longimicrobium sp.]|nr:hypothetical protein [Longimicrobium sp.]
MTENARGCYCHAGDTTCGTCERCGGAGHTRHFPGPVPYTGAWCDRCYRIVAWTHPSRWLTLIVILLLAAPFLARCVG